jgi:hypothetical protein
MPGRVDICGLCLLVSKGAKLVVALLEGSAATSKVADTSAALESVGQRTNKTAATASRPIHSD